MPQNFVKPIFQVGTNGAGKLVLAGRLAGGDNVVFRTSGNTDIKLPQQSPEPGSGAAEPGEIGELIESFITQAGGVTFTTDAVTDITSISLTPGDWWVFGHVAVLGVAGTTLTKLHGGSSNTSATLDFAHTFFWQGASFTLGANPFGFAIPARRISLPVTSTIYLVSVCSFGAATLKGWGRLSASRAR